MILAKFDFLLDHLKNQCQDVLLGVNVEFDRCIIFSFKTIMNHPIVVKEVLNFLNVHVRKLQHLHTMQCKLCTIVLKFVQVEFKNYIAMFIQSSILLELILMENLAPIWGEFLHFPLQSSIFFVIS